MNAPGAEVANEHYRQYLGVRSLHPGELDVSLSLFRDGDVELYPNIYPEVDREDHSDSYDSLPPELAIVTPIDIMGESLDTISEFIASVRQATSWLPVADVFLWCNTKALDGTYVAQAENKFDLLRDRLPRENIHSPHLRIGLQHSYIPEHWGLNEIRSASMDTLGLLATARHFRPGLPILWLDVDTLNLGRGVLYDLRHSIQQQRAHFVKAQLKFVDDRPNKLPLAQQTETDKVATIYAEARYLLERCLQPSDSRGYVDECGLGFMLGAYLLSGGNSLADPELGESRTLLTRASDRLDTSSIPLLIH
ncbi:MAG TPA: hypothetical protein VL737_03070, partial [Candidatus Pristimantibacillus sp.]|nr:hypothetical protein [Candidatus Pristimantibacillus sp.]